MDVFQESKAKKRSAEVECFPEELAADKRIAEHVKAYNVRNHKYNF